MSPKPRNSTLCDVIESLVLISNPINPLFGKINLDICLLMTIMALFSMGGKERHVTSEVFKVRVRCDVSLEKTLSYLAALSAHSCLHDVSISAAIS